MELILVPTAGNCRNALGRLTPSSSCKKRLAKAAMLLRRDKTSMLAIVGGKREKVEDCEAEVAAKYFLKLFPEFRERILMVDASAKYTAADMVAFAKRLRQEKLLSSIDRIKVVTHRNHFRLIERTLNSCQVGSLQRVDSFELAPYGRFTQFVLNLVTTVDPKWERLISLPLRILANQRSDPAQAGSFL